MDDLHSHTETEEAAEIDAPQDFGETPSSRPAPASSRRKDRRALRRVLLLGVPLAACAGALGLYLHGGRWVSTDDAYVRADIVSIADDTAGTVSQVDVVNNQRVKKGQLLFRLDPTRFRLALDSAEAQVTLATNQLHALKEDFREAQQQVDRAAADLALAQKTIARQKALAANQFASRAALDRAAHDAAAARARLAGAKAKADALMAQLGGEANLPLDKFPKYRAALAKAAIARRNLNHASVYAPADGVLANVDSLRPGDYLAKAQTAMSLVSTQHVWIVADYKETDLTYMHVGDKAEFSVDAYPGHVFHARVAALSPATAAQFSVLPAQNTSGNWVKVVQRLPVRLDIIPAAGDPPLRAGLSVNVDVDTGHERTLFGAQAAAR